MIFINEISLYAKVWSMTHNEKYTDIRMSTSEKLADGSYKSSTWFARCIGQAANTLKKYAKEGDRICIKKFKLTNESYTDKDGKTKSSLQFIILELEMANGTQQTTPQKPEAKPAKEKKQEVEDLPW